jgi:hypothetical protein
MGLGHDGLPAVAVAGVAHDGDAGPRGEAEGEIGDGTNGRDRGAIAEGGEGIRPAESGARHQSTIG